MVSVLYVLSVKVADGCHGELAHEIGYAHPFGDRTRAGNGSGKWIKSSIDRTDGRKADADPPPAWRKRKIDIFGPLWEDMRKVASQILQTTAASLLQSNRGHRAALQTESYYERFENWIERKSRRERNALPDNKSSFIFAS